MLAVARHILFADKALRQGAWDRRHTGSELWNKILGLVGFGSIGSAVAKRALGFSMSVLVYDPYIRPDQTDLVGVRLAPLEEVIASADFLSLHAPLTDETRNLIGADQLNGMKPTAYLINTARGGLVDERALYQALASGQIAGAAMDVFTEEPPTGSPLLALENVVLTPHMGTHTRESIERMGVIAVQNVVRTLQGGKPLYPVMAGNE
jgi:D-3-phosphoglycerate dehydrogenase